MGFQLPTCPHTHTHTHTHMGFGDTREYIKLKESRQICNQSERDQSTPLWLMRDNLQ